MFSLIYLFKRINILGTGIHHHQLDSSHENSLKKCV
jgi:hypothetical protein